MCNFLTQVVLIDALPAMLNNHAMDAT